MATMNVGILTTAGKTLLDRVESGQTKITYSKMVFSSMDNSSFSDAQLLGLTLITPQEVVINDPQAMLDRNNGETKIRGNGDNSALSSGVYIKTYGVYAKDDDGNEILYGLTVSDHPNYLAPFDGLTPQAVTYTYKTTISRTDQVNFTNSADIYLTDQDLKDAVSVLVTETDFTAAINSKQDKINYVPANDAKVVHTTDTNFVNKVSLDDVQFKQLADGTDLLKLTNNTAREQYYACDTDVHAQTMVNCPVKNAFALVSIPISKTASMNANGYPAYNYVRLVLYRYDCEETWTANINTASGMPTSNGWSRVVTGDVSRTSAIYRGAVSMNSFDFNSFNSQSKGGMYEFGGTVAWKNGPSTIQGTDRWGSIEYWYLGSTGFAEIKTNQSEIFYRQLSGSPQNWGNWFQVPKMDMTGDVTVHDVLNQETGEWLTATQNRLKWSSRPFCAKGTDFGTFLKSASVPTGFSIVRDDNTYMNWYVIKESNLYVYGWAIGGGLTTRSFMISNGTYTTDNGTAAVKDIQNTANSALSAINNLKAGTNANGANLNTQNTFGNYYSNTAVVNGPFGSETYVAWSVFPTANTILQVAWKLDGRTATRMYWNGSGWSAWTLHQGFLQASSEADAKTKSASNPTDLYYTLE